MATQNLPKRPLTDSKWVWRSLRGTAQATDEEKPAIPADKRKATYPHSSASWVIFSIKANLSSLPPPQLLFIKYSSSFAHALNSTVLPSSHLPTWVLRLLFSKTLPSTQYFFLIILFLSLPPLQLREYSICHCLHLQPPVHPNFKPL